MTTDPKLGTFLYLWYTKGPNWGNWSECQPADAGNVTDCNAIGKGNEIIPCPNPNDHVPPGRWAGRYLPKLDGIGQPGDLYSSQDTNVMIKQLQLIKDAGIGLIIASYWGQNNRSNTALDILRSTLESSENPHPDAKYCIYYEDAANKSQTTIESDINNLSITQFNSPYYLKVNNKPMVWVYGSSNLTLAQKWNSIRINKGLYIIQKEWGSEWKSNTNLADSWHQYAPAGRYGITQTTTKKYSSFVSPGFYRYHSCERLKRCDHNNDYTDFENALIQMKNDGAEWHTIQTWNEWEECSGIEPSVEMNHIEGGTSPFTIKGVPYGTKYIDLIAKYFGPTPVEKMFNTYNIVSNDNIKKGVIVIQKDFGTFTKDQACADACTKLGQV